MNILFANTINELEKILLKKKNIFFLIVTGVITALFSIGINLFQSKFGVAAVTGSNYPIAVLGLFVKVFLPLFIYLAAADLIAGEAQHKTLKLSLTRPISRFKVYLSKNLAIGFYAVINLFVVLIVSIAAGMFFSVKGQIFSGVIRSFGAYAVDIIPALVLTITAVFIAQFFKSSTTSLISCIFIYIALYILSMFFPLVLRSSFTNYLDWHVIWLSGNISILRLLNILLMILSYGIIFFSAGFYFFDKKDL